MPRHHHHRSLHRTIGLAIATLFVLGFFAVGPLFADSEQYRTPPTTLGHF